MSVFSVSSALPSGVATVTWKTGWTLSTRSSSWRNLGSNRQPQAYKTVALNHWATTAHGRCLESGNTNIFHTLISFIGTYSDPENTQTPDFSRLQSYKPSPVSQHIIAFQHNNWASAPTWGRNSHFSAHVCSTTLLMMEPAENMLDETLGPRRGGSNIKCTWLLGIVGFDTAHVGRLFGHEDLL